MSLVGQCLAIRLILELYLTRMGIGYFLLIKQAMRMHDASFGAERSGHYYFKDFFFAESGIRAAIEMINVVSGLRGEGKTIHEYVKSFSHYTRGKEMNVAIGVHNSGHILNEFLESFKNE